jgi:metal-responsive CopG/Arc/MetJ family transcriptional regulator
LQLKINKRNQLKRDKDKGLHRVELKLDAESLDDLNQLADARGISRSELIQELVREYVSTQRSSQLK